MPDGITLCVSVQDVVSQQLAKKGKELKDNSSKLEERARTAQSELNGGEITQKVMY